MSERDVPRRLQIIRKLQALAQTGLAYSQNPFDLERYEAIRGLTAELLADGSDVPADVPLATFAREQGYATPKVDVRAAVFQDGKLLLVREKADGGWTLPGGWADVGCSPAEAAVKEVREESGYEVRASRLLWVLDRDKQGHPPMLFHVYKILIQCELVGGAAAQQTTETDGVGFFGRDEVPPLSISRVLPHEIERVFEMHAHPDCGSLFD